MYLEYMNPFNKADAQADLDNDGLSNIFEYENGLDIRSNDTDHDGIDDGEEYHYWRERLREEHSTWDNESINATAINYTRNPDVDNDSIPDGKEIEGYWVKVIYWDGNTPRSEMLHITELDPLIPYGYNSSEGFKWTDTDVDHIPDAVESMVSNESRFMDFYNFTHKQGWMRDYMEQLWNDYAWTIAYYFAIKLNKTWDEIYSNLRSNPEYWIHTYSSEAAHNESCKMNATSYLSSQYNPMVIEKMPPVIVKFDVSFYYEIVTAKVDVHLIVRDVGGVEYVKIVDNDFIDQYVEWSGLSKKVEIEHTFWASPWGANLCVNITVEARDWCHHSVSMSRAIEGPIGHLIHLFLQWLGQFFKFLVQIAKAVMKALQWIVDFIVGLLKEAFNKFVAILQSVANGYSGEIMDVIYGRKTLGSTSLVAHAEIFGYGIIGTIMTVGIFATVLSGGLTKAASLMTRVMSGEFIKEFLTYVEKGGKVLTAFLFGALLRFIEEFVLQQENISESQKEAIKTVGDLMAAGVGMASGLFGDEDLKDLVWGYIVFILGILWSYIVKNVGKLYRLNDESIKIVIITGEAILLIILLWITVKSLVTFTVSDAIGGIAGYFDEFILGFLFASSLITFGETVIELFQKLLAILPSYSTSSAG